MCTFAGCGRWSFDFDVLCQTHRNAKQASKAPDTHRRQGLVAAADQCPDERCGHVQASQRTGVHVQVAGGGGGSLVAATLWFCSWRCVAKHAIRRELRGGDDTARPREFVETPCCGLQVDVTDFPWKPPLQVEVTIHTGTTGPVFPADLAPIAAELAEAAATPDGKTTPAKVRAWAIAQGITVADRGRIARDIVDRYHAATGTAATA